MRISPHATAPIETRELVLGVIGALVGAVVWALLTTISDSRGWSWVLALIAYSGFGFFSVVLASNDLRAHRLPNRLVVWCSAWVLVLLSASSVSASDVQNLLLTYVASAAFAAGALILWLFVRAQIGAGDVKLMPVVAFAALWGAPKHALIAGASVFLLTLLLGTMIAGIRTMLVKRTKFAAAPILIASAWVTLVVCSPVFLSLLHR